MVGYLGRISKGTVHACVFFPIPSRPASLALNVVKVVTLRLVSITWWYYFRFDSTVRVQLLTAVTLNYFHSTSFVLNIIHLRIPICFFSLRNALRSFECRNGIQRNEAIILGYVCSYVQGVKHFLA